jgi:hypothetical protein
VLLRDRLYINRGDGSFGKSDNAIPDFRYNTSVAAPCDFDQDGDVDLFIGSLSVSRIYGIDPRHYLLENDGTGKFSDITEARAYRFRDMGMVTDACWEDMDGDGLEDLVATGLWMAPSVFNNTGRRLVPVESPMDTLTGWWNAIEVADLDGDGDQDIVLGNRGTNSFIKVSSLNPVKMFINDFDNNGTIEQILTRFTEGKDKPISLKREITMQIPSLNKEDLRFSDYAEMSVYDLFSEDLISNSIRKEVIISESLILYNEGIGQFRIETLPVEIQFTCVNVIRTADVNGDGRTDLILGENNHGFKPQFGRLDAGFAHILEAGEDGFNRPVRIGRSGLGVVNSIGELTLNGKRYLLLGINDDKPRMYEISR